MRRLTCIYLWIFLCLSVCTYAQVTNTVLDDEVKDAVSIFKYINKAMLFNQKVPQEKVYLHFDNTSYFEGETMWFKAYVMRTDSCRLSDLSRVLYVELLNPTGDVIKKRKYKIDGDGLAHGDIQLDTIGSHLHGLLKSRHSILRRILPVPATCAAMCPYLWFFH